MIIIDAINRITDCNVTNNGKFSKRLIKFLLLSAGFGSIDVLENTDKKYALLLEIESKLPSFNSGDPKKVENTFAGYPKEIIEYYNKLFILGRGSHSTDSTKKIISLLKDIMEFEERRQVLQ